MERWTGRETRLLRKALRLTVRDFADHLGVSPRTVSKWETAGATRTPRPELQAALDTVIQRATDGQRERFEQALRGAAQLPDAAIVRPVDWVVDLREPQAAEVSEAGVRLPLVVDGLPMLATLDAQMLAAIGLTVPLGRVTAPELSLSLPALTPDEHEQLTAARHTPGRYVDASAVAALRRQLEACQADDQAAGPTSTLPVVLTLLNLIDTEARDVTPEVRCQLLSLGARGAEFAGWLYRDLRDIPRAVLWYDRATAWAQEAGDLPMQGYILLKKSQLAYDERQALRVVTLARAARQGPWRSPIKVRAEVLQQVARGMAMTGASLDDVSRRLDEAQELLARPEDETDEAARLATHYGPAQLLLQTASCYLEAGSPLMAAELYGDVLTAADLAPRDRGYFLARRAHSLALAGQPDHAAAVGRESVALADVTQSARTRRELGRALAVLGPWQGRPGPRELREALNA